MTHQSGTRTFVNSQDGIVYLEEIFDHGGKTDLVKLQWTHITGYKNTTKLGQLLRNSSTDTHTLMNQHAYGSP